MEPSFLQRNEIVTVPVVRVAGRGQETSLALPGLIAESATPPSVVVYRHAQSEKFLEFDRCTIKTLSWLVVSRGYRLWTFTGVAMSSRISFAYFTPSESTCRRIDRFTQLQESRVKGQLIEFDSESMTAFIDIVDSKKQTRDATRTGKSNEMLTESTYPFSFHRITLSLTAFIGRTCMETALLRCEIIEGGDGS
jgi:hypothetical protein